MNLSLKPFDASGTAVIAGLADRIWRAYYIRIISMVQIDYMLDKFYSKDSLLQQMSEGQEFYGIMLDNELSGFVSYSRKNDHEYFIHKFYLIPELHGKHIGSEVMHMLFERMQERSAGMPFEVRLTVNRQNYQAINFYFRNGFIIEKTADFDIGEGYFMNDFVMLYRKKN